MSHLAIDQLSAALDGALDGPVVEEALAHLSSCVRCRERQARLAGHDDTLRRLLAHDPVDRVLDELARHSEAIATAVVRGLPLPPFATSTPLVGEEKLVRPAAKTPDRVPVERLLRFQPPAAFGPASIPQDSHATPAKADEPLPPPRDPSRPIRRPEGIEPRSPLDVTPRLDTERVKSERPVESIAEGYDVFNDGAYAGPTARQLPPQLGGTPVKRDGEPGPETPAREYRHGGVRRDTPAASDSPGESTNRREDRGKPAAREQGFGVPRPAAPAWSRLGLEPDPFSPGSFRDTLTGATVSPPVIVPTPGRPGGSRSRTVLMVGIVTGGAVLALLFVMRIPTGARLSLGSGHLQESATTTPTSGAVREATTPPPVDVAVPPAATDTPALAAGEVRLCGVVLDVTGRPLANALLTVAGRPAQVRSDADGHFCLAAPAGTQAVDVMDPRSTSAASRRFQIEFVAGAPVARVVMP